MRKKMYVIFHLWCMSTAVHCMSRAYHFIFGLIWTIEMGAVGTMHESRRMEFIISEWMCVHVCARYRCKQKPVETYTNQIVQLKSHQSQSQSNNAHCAGVFCFVSDLWMHIAHVQTEWYAGNGFKSRFVICCRCTYGNHTIWIYSYSFNISSWRHTRTQNTFNVIEMRAAREQNMPAFRKLSTFSEMGKNSKRQRKKHQTSGAFAPSVPVRVWFDF